MREHACTQNAATDDDITGGKDGTLYPGTSKTPHQDRQQNPGQVASQRHEDPSFQLDGPEYSIACVGLIPDFCMRQTKEVVRKSSWLGLSKTTLVSVSQQATGESAPHVSCCRKRHSFRCGKYA